MKYKDLKNQKYWLIKAGDESDTQVIINQIKKCTANNYKNVDNGLKTYVPVIRKFLNKTKITSDYIKRRPLSVVKQNTLIRKVKLYFKKYVPMILKWTTRRTYLCAIQWFLVQFLECKKAKITIRKIKDEKLPMVEWEEYNLMLKHCKRCTFNKGDPKNQCNKIHTGCIFESKRNQLMIKFLYDTGARASELCKLKVQDYSFDDCRGMFYNTKGGKKRPFKLSLELHKDLVQFIKQNPQKCNKGTPYVFHSNKFKNEAKPLTVRSLEYVVSKLVEKAKLDRKITPHSFRRSYATNLYNQNIKLIAISNALGHDSIQSTEIYIRQGKNLKGIPTGLDAAESGQQSQQKMDKNIQSTGQNNLKMENLIKQVLKQQVEFAKQQDKLFAIIQMKDEQIKQMSQIIENLKRKQEITKPKEEPFIKKLVKFEIVQQNPPKSGN